MSNLNDKATKAASRYLEHRGYTVLETAWKCPAGTCDVIADADDLQRLNRITLDGETILAQTAGVLVDISALSWASEVADVFVPQMVQFHRLIESVGATRAEDLGIPTVVLQNLASPFDQEREQEQRF